MLQYIEVLQFNEGYHRIATLQYIGLPPIPDTPQKKIQKTPSGDPKT